MSPTSEFLFWRRKGQHQMKRGAAVQWKATQWQQSSRQCARVYAIWAEWCHDLAYQRGNNDVCRGRPEHSSLMREHCLRCSTPPPFYHGKRSHLIVTQCVRVRACMQKPTTWRRRDWVVLVCPDLPTNMSPRDKMSSHCGVVGIITSPTTGSIPGRG